MKSSIPSLIPALLSRASALLLLLATVAFPALPAQTLPPINGTYNFYVDTLFDGTDSPSLRQALASETIWRVADGVTVTVANSGSLAAGIAGGIFVAGSQTLRIEPLDTTGRVRFIGNGATQDGGVFTVGGRLYLTNVDFIENRATLNSTANADGGGAIQAAATSVITMTDVLFQKNRGKQGGAIHTLGDMLIYSGTFTGNYAHGWNLGGGTGGTVMGNANAGHGGALNLTHGVMRLVIARESSFTNNWARRGGGAISARARHSIELWDTVDLSNNFSGYGGAICDSISVTEATEGVFLKYSGTTGITHFIYSGNMAKGSDMTAAEITASEATGTATFTPLARAGGFYQSANYNNATTQTRLSFDIATGVTVQIGEAGNPSAWDSFATIDATAAGARLDLSGTGAGRLILHADNSYFQGTVSINTGSLLLGNQDAQLGGVINVASGATFGGSGTLTTRLQNATTSAGRTSLNLADGATLILGTETATGAETLHVAGNVTAAGNNIFNHDLFAGDSASKLSVTGNLSLTGPATINIGLLATGTFTIMEWSGAGLAPANLANLSLTVAGIANNPRANPALSLSGATLVVTNTIFNNLIMKWTGAEGAAWTRRTTSAQLNWADSSGSGESRFYNADSVVFDGVTDAANAANRLITIADGGVTVSGMEVTGGTRYEFRGNGGIEADANSISNATFTPTGILKKSGEGELVFANTGANNFLGGIEIAGGILTFNRAAQLGSGAGGILFSDSGTLRANSTVTGTLAEKLTVAADKTGELAVDAGGTLIYDGALASGGAGATLRKTGAGAALFTGDNTASTLPLSVDEGALLVANTAVLGGDITVNSGATLGGAGTAGNGGHITLASGGILEAGLDTMQPATLTVHNLTMTGGAILRMDLFADADAGVYRKSDRIIEAGTSAISGVNTINLTSFASGTFNLGNLTGLATNGLVTISGMTLATGGRLSAVMSNNAGTLEFVMTSDQSRVMKWTGAGNSTWNLANTNWTDTGAVNQYSYGDRVLFDGSATARNIFIDAGEVRVADITVSGNADHTFTGGGIHAWAGNVQENGITDATGKLVKTGDGTLTLANGKNTFLGGVELGGGALVIGSGDHLTTTDTTGITFTGDATLRASADMTLDDDILIAAGKTAAFDSGGHDMTLAGTLTAAADTTLAKTGTGAVVLESDLTGFSGTLAVRGGTLRAGATDVLTAAAAANATIVVNTGATLDLAGHDQTLTKLQGAGTVELGTAKLTMDIDAAGASFAGAFAGAGTVIKAGDGKWTLSGSSSHTGGILFQSGEIGLTNSHALGAGPLTLDTQSGQLSIDANGLNIPNNLVAGTGTLTLATNGRAVEFSGAIVVPDVVLDGTGTVTLSGANGYTQLQVNTPLVIARRAEAAAGTIAIADGSTFEFRGVESGQVTATLTGDRVLFTDSTLTLTKASILNILEINKNSRVTASVAGALGGADADITVRGVLGTTVQNTQARNMAVDGGALEFGSTPLGSTRRISSFALSGTLSFFNGGEVRLGNRLSTGSHDAAIAAGGITGTPEYNANQDGMFMTVDVVDGNLLRITAYDMALEPAKDIAAGFDAMRASMDAVFSHLSDQLLAPMAGDKTPATKQAFWARLIGSYATHETTREYLGYTGNTFSVVLGYDLLSGGADSLLGESEKNLMLGAYLAYANTRLTTANDATTNIGLPILGLYGAKRWGNYYAAADLAYGKGGANTTRLEPLGGRVTGSYDLDSIAANVSAGRVFAFSGGRLLRPSLGINYTTLSFRNYSETGDGAVRLDNLRTDLLQAVARIDGSCDIKMPWGLPGMVDLGLGLRRNLDNMRTDVHATLIEHPDTRLPIRGDKYVKNTVIASLGLRAMLSKTTLFALSYGYDYMPYGSHRNTFMATIRQSW